MMLDFLNNNAGLVAILGVIVGWVLNMISDHIKYNRSKKEEEEKEQRERFKNKA